MKYCSVRGLENDLSFEDILFRGYAKDGGLYMPQVIPQVPDTKLNEMKNFSYTNIVKTILRIYIDECEISTDNLNDLIDEAHSQFDIPEIIKISRLKDNLIIAEMFHGETLAFKDLALSIIGKLYQYFLKKREKHTIILVGTSGDTGSSAICGVRGLDGIDIIVLYPKNYCTEIQKLQMITVIDDNVHCFAVDGTSDELDVPIKQCLTDKKFVENYNISCLNSINWCRIAVQIAHYFYVYLQLCSQGQSLEIIIPSGGAGNLTAGFMAAKMGLPITLVPCTNVNACLSDFVKYGTLKIGNKASPTLAPAMDIQVPYNLERLVYLASNSETAIAKSFGSDFDENRNIILPDLILKELQTVITSADSFSDEDIKSTIQHCWHENSYRICPHTATAVAFHYRQTQQNDKIRVCLATASADKFPSALTASDVPPNVNNKIEQLYQLKQKFSRLNLGDDWVLILKNKIQDIGNKYL